MFFQCNGIIALFYYIIWLCYIFTKTIFNNIYNTYYSCFLIKMFFNNDINCNIIKIIIIIIKFSIVGHINTSNDTKYFRL